MCQSSTRVHSPCFPGSHWSTGSRRGRRPVLATLGRKSRPGAAAQRASEPWAWARGPPGRDHDQRAPDGFRKQQREGGGQMQVSLTTAWGSLAVPTSPLEDRVGRRHGADSQSSRRRPRPSTMALVSQRRMRCFFGANRAADGPGNGAGPGGIVR